MNQFYTLISVLIVSLISFIGVLTIFLKRKKIANLIFILVSFSVGALLGDAFIHLLPETFEELGVNYLSSILILAGILAFFVLEKFIRWHHCHDNQCEEESHHHLAIMNLVGDGVHNFIDGILIAASFLVSVPLGLATTLAVILHEIPQEISDTGVLLHAGVPIKKALLYNFYSALLAVAGAVLCIIIGAKSQNFALYLLPVTAGGFIYIAGSDLIPELHHETKLTISLAQFAAIIAGVLIMLALAIYIK